MGGKMATQTATQTSADPTATPTIHLRPALNSSANSSLTTALAAFSPDIIPLDQVEATPAELIATYNEFIAHSIDLDEPTTSIYIRGKQDRSQPVTSPTLVALAILRAVPNELVLWPQVWGTANVIGHTGLQLDSDTVNQIAVGGAPIQYSPIPISGEDHSHITLIATVAAPNAAFSVPKVKNWRDLVEHVGENTSLAFYNVQTADPTSRKATLTTKFRLIENETAHVELFFGIETMGVPTTGIDVSLNMAGKGPNNTPFSFAIDRQAVSPTGVYGKNVKVPSGFEGNVTLDVFNYDKQVFGDYSSVSIVVYAVDSAGDVLLGADHLVFDSNPRVKRLARKYNYKSQEVPSTQSLPPFFYYRQTLADTANFPRTGNPSASPDVQPLGTVQDPNPAVTLANFSVDVSTQRQISVYSDTSNYVYLRGNAVTPHTGQTRLFYITGQILLHPSVYSQPANVVFDVDDNNDPIVAYRPYTAISAQPIIITRPFTLNNLPSVHHCAIAECLPDGETQWPHEIVSNFATSAEFAAWVVSEPCVAWRNLSWMPNPNPDTQTLQTSFTIPPGYSATDKFQFQVQAIGFTLGSAFSVTSDDPSILFPETNIVSDPTIATSAFTGKSPGFTAQITLHWFAKGQAVKTGQNLSAVLIQIVPQASNLGQVVAASSEGVALKDLTYHVGKDYPNLINPKAKRDARAKIGGAIRARSLGPADEDADFESEFSDPFIPILRGIVVGVDKITF